MKTESKVLDQSIHGRQRGLTLIEIMVALLIGSFLLAGVLQIFIVNRQTYRVQENLSRIQENGRFAIDYLNRYIRLAGYIADETFLDLKNRNQNKRGTLTPIVFNTTTNNALVGGNSVGLNNSDSITVRFQGNPPYNPMTDCLGNTIISASGNVVATNQFSIPTGLQDNNLYCNAGHRTAAGAVVAGTSQTQPVIEGVENMQLRYCSRKPDNISCVRADLVPDWTQVESIKISLLVRSVDDNLISEPKSYRFDLDGDPGTGDDADEIITPPATDRHLRRVFTTTIAVRNLVQ